MADCSPGRLSEKKKVLLLIAQLRRLKMSFPRWAELVPAYGIGTIAMYWFIQRTISIWTF